MIFERDNLRFSSRAKSQRPDNNAWLIDVTRISDGHWQRGQMWFDHDPTSQDMTEAAALWIMEHPGKSEEPPVVRCISCDKVLVSDTDTNYQFDNALWIGFHGGYAMFVDACDFPINTEDRYLKGPDGDWLTIETTDGKREVVEDPEWEPEYKEERVLPGRPDHEAVICHECAHDLCETVPWIGKLLQPARSHAHRSADIPRLLAEGHAGWDLHQEREESMNSTEASNE